MAFETVEQHKVRQFARTIITLVQQEESVFLPLVTVDTDVVGESKSFDRMDSVEAIDVISRHQKTILQDIIKSRRWANMTDSVITLPVDSEDQLKTLTDPMNTLAVQSRRGMARKIDDKIITAFFGNASAGKSPGDSQVALPAGQILDVQLGGGGMDTGMNIEKLRGAAKVMNKLEVPKGNRHIAIGADQLDDLLASTETTSSDFAVVKALHRGEIDSFMGFTFHDSQRLPLAAATNYRSVVAWHKEHIGFAWPMTITSNQSTRHDLNDAEQILTKLSCGAVRIQEEGVVSIPCLEV